MEMELLKMVIDIEEKYHCFLSCWKGKISSSGDEFKKSE